VNGEESLLREAEDLGVPWREILEGEIRAERMLGAFLDASQEQPLERLLLVLSSNPLQSWRVRHRIERLRWEALPESGNGIGARRELGWLDRYLRGRSERPPAAALRASRLLLTYQRVRELLTICRLASKARRGPGDPIDRLRAVSKCGLEDAKWAVAREDGGSRGQGLEDAFSKARDEGLEMPPGRTAPEAFLRLREYLHRRGLLRNGNGSGSLRKPHSG